MVHLAISKNQNLRLQEGPSAFRGGDARRIIKAKQVLQNAHNIVTLTQSAVTPYASKSKGVKWYEQ